MKLLCSAEWLEPDSFLSKLGKKNKKNKENLGRVAFLLGRFFAGQDVTVEGGQIDALVVSIAFSVAIT